MTYKLYLPRQLRIEAEAIIINRQEEENINDLIKFALEQVLPLIGIKEMEGLHITHVGYITETGEMKIELSNTEERL